MRFERWFYALPVRLRTVLRRRQLEDDLDSELRYHVEREIEECVARGMSPAEARGVVLRRFGSIDNTKDRCRDARGATLIDTLVQDLGYGARTLSRNPGFALVTVVTLALGIGANTAVFSLIEGILLAELPYPSPHRLVSITGTYPNGAFVEMREGVRTVDVGAYVEGQSFTLKDGGDPIRLAGARISAELFPILGVRPVLGRWLRPGEDVAGQDHYVILSDALWQARFARDETVVGRFVELDGVRRQVVAVMPASFHFPSVRTQVWLPLGTDSRNTARYWAGDFMPVVGRLRTDSHVSQAHAEIRRFQANVLRSFPWTMPASWNRDVTVIPLKNALVGDVQSQLLILIAAVAIVLVIACANVANLTLSRSVARDREISIRAAIGAGPLRIARQLVTESLLLASLGALVGLLLATQAVAVMKIMLPYDTPRLHEVHLNWRVLVFTAVVTVVTGCALALAPVQRAMRLRLWTALCSGGREARRTVAGPLRAMLTVGQIACTVLLVIAAGLLVRSLWTLSRVDPGFTHEGVVTARISPSQSLCANPSRCLAFYRAFEEQAQAVAGVQSAALVNTLPLTGAVAKRSIEIQGYSVAPTETAPLIWLNVVTPDYFSVMNMRMEAGRPFTREDLAGPRVAIVSASTVRRFWPEQSPIGSRVRFVGESHWHTIVGVAADVRAFDLTRSIPEWMAGTVYVPHTVNATMEDGRIPGDMTLALRTTIADAQLTPMLRQAARRVSTDVVIDEVKPMRGVIADAVAAPSATASLLVGMAALALTLGCVGVYGVLSFIVSRQTQDFGIRIALGAQRRDVFWVVMKEGAQLCAAGIIVGVGGALAATRWLSSELYGVSSTDPATYLTVVAFVAIVTLTACYAPTRRAMAVDPLTVLRDQ